MSLKNPTYSGMERLEVAKRHLFSFWRHNTPKKLANFLRAEAAMHRRETRVKSLPFMIKIEPTRLCNLACPGCPSGLGNAGSPDLNMPLSLYRKIVDDLGNCLYKISLYGWGEPLLNRDIYDMIAYASARNIGVVISSNLLALTPSNAERLLNCGLEHLIVSIDGMSQETYEKYRVGGNLSRVLANLRTLLEMRRELGNGSLLVEWQFLLSKDNENELEESRRAAAEIGVDRFTVKSFFDEATGYLAADKSIVAADGTPKHQMIKRKRACYWLWGNAEILYDGTVIPCCFKSSKPVMGSVAEDSFASVWNNETYCADRTLFRRDLKENPPNATKECLNCALFQ